MKFLAVSIAAIFLSVSASTAETTNSPISSQLAATPKAGKKISSKVRKLAPRVCPTQGDDECRAWCCTCGAKCLGTGCNPPHCP
jgi:hypothetical protein